MPIFALVDCNNFYASCEKVFQPNLNKKPLIVLSNNDGCVIARSQEAKALGISMGVPVFKIKHTIKKHNVKTFSSNYALYGDMSSRVMNILAEKCPDIEIYSIDECFLDLKKIEDDNTEWCKEARRIILKWVGIPVSIGIGPTKTLAKIANKIAKSEKEISGVFNFYNVNDKETNTILKNISVKDIWGIGKQWAKMLSNNHIYSAFDLKRTPKSWIREKMGITGLRIVYELSGKSCYKLETNSIPKKSVRCSRTFSKAISDKEQVFDAIRLFVQIAASKIRKKNQACQAIQVFISTDKFKKNTQQYYNSKTNNLINATSDSVILTIEARKIFNKLWKNNYLYRKGGVLLSNLSIEGASTPGLFYREKKENHKLMETIDRINQKFGNNTLELGLKEKKSEWIMKQHHISSKFTTQWTDIIKVSIN